MANNWGMRTKEIDRKAKQQAKRQRKEERRNAKRENHSAHAEPSDRR